jgi:hypothetical protein
VDFQIAGILWPLSTLLMVPLVLISLHYLLITAWPQASVYRILFDVDFRDRHPVATALGWISVVILWMTCNAVLYLL